MWDAQFELELLASSSGISYSHGPSAESCSQAGSELDEGILRLCGGRNEKTARETSLYYRCRTLEPTSVSLNRPGKLLLMSEEDGRGQVLIFFLPFTCAFRSMHNVLLGLECHAGSLLASERWPFA